MLSPDKLAVLDSVSNTDLKDFKNLFMKNEHGIKLTVIKRLVRKTSDEKESKTEYDF